MHTTLTTDVKGYIDEITESRVRGWTFYAKTMEVLPLRLYYDNTFEDIECVDRKDVATFYKNDDILVCGWELSIDSKKIYIVKINIEGQWQPALAFKAVPAPTRFDIRKSIPSFVVVDNFYEDPDAVRKFALTCDFKEHPANHKGKRTDQCYRFEGLKERFEELVGAKIIDWGKYGTNGCFQYCIGGEQSVYHCDAQRYAGVLFLTPDAPPQSGTSFFRSINNKKMIVEPDDHNIIFDRGFLDPTRFQRVDTVGNVYNRLVLFDARLIHAGNDYFGTTKENGRLFQLFFFDIEE